MDKASLERMMESPNYSSIDELFDKAELNDVERDAFVRNRKYCEYWLLRSKRMCHQSFNPDLPNFIKRLARVLNYLESNAVRGEKKQKIKEMFGMGSPVHRVYSTKNGCRSTQNSQILENTYFELLILSFLVERGFEIEMIKSREAGKRIPEFIASRDGLKLAGEAKNLDVDSLLDNIFGDSFIDGFDHRRTEEEREKGYQKIKSQIEKRYEDAIGKFHYINNDEKYIVFMSIYYDNRHIGNPAINYIDSIQSTWSGNNMQNFLGLVIPQYDQTIFIENTDSDHKILSALHDIGIQEFHNFVP